jgi:hypothetical protein
VKGFEGNSAKQRGNFGGGRRRRKRQMRGATFRLVLHHVGFDAFGMRTSP